MVANNRSKLETALDDIDRLLEAAERGGMPVERWLAEVAEELRATVPSLDAEAAAFTIRKILADPHRSRGAHAQIGPAALKALSG